MVEGVTVLAGGIALCAVILAVLVMVLGLLSIWDLRWDLEAQSTRRRLEALLRADERS